jgi:hypothetical protein
VLCGVSSEPPHGSYGRWSAKRKLSDADTISPEPRRSERLGKKDKNNSETSIAIYCNEPTQDEFTFELLTGWPFVLRVNHLMALMADGQPNANFQMLTPSPLNRDDPPLSSRCPAHCKPDSYCLRISFDQFLAKVNEKHVNLMALMADGQPNANFQMLTPSPLNRDDPND